jgi:hypothetical protein
MIVEYLELFQEYEWNMENDQFREQPRPGGHEFEECAGKVLPKWRRGYGEYVGESNLKKHVDKIPQSVDSFALYYADPSNDIAEYVENWKRQNGDWFRAVGWRRRGLDLLISCGKSLKDCSMHCWTACTAVYRQVKVFKVWYVLCWWCLHFLRGLSSRKRVWPHKISVCYSEYLQLLKEFFTALHRSVPAITLTPPFL